MSNSRLEVFYEKAIYKKKRLWWRNNIFGAYYFTSNCHSS